MFSIMRSQTIFSLCPLLLLLSFSLSLLPSASALRIIVTPTTRTDAPTTVYWIREPSDPQPLFDLRFVVQPEGTEGEADVGLAAANIPISVGSGDGEVRMGKEEVRFPKSGQYVLKAVAGPDFQVIGTSNEVVVSPLGTITLSTTPTSTSTTGKSTETNETGLGGSQTTPSPKSKTPLIVGATLGSLTFLALVALLLWFLLRRRRLARERDRLSFRPEDMVSRRRSKAKWVSRLSLRVQARDGNDNGPASAPVGGTFPTTENPFATPARTPPGTKDREREVSFAQPPVTPSASNVLASVPPSRRELIAREMRGSSASVSMYSQESLVSKDVDVEAQSTESKPTERKRRSGAWTLVEQALENVKRRASMVSRSSSIVPSTPLPAPVSASPYVTSFTPASILGAATSTSTSNQPQPQPTSIATTMESTTPAPTTAAPQPRNMAERAGKRISILPHLPPVSLSTPPQAHGDGNVRGLPPVPLGPAFDAVSLLSASGSEGESEAMSEKARGKQRSDSVLKGAGNKAKLETIPASPASTVSGTLGHGSVHLPVITGSSTSTISNPSTPVPAPVVVEEKSVIDLEEKLETKEQEKKKTEAKRPLPTPVIHAPTTTTIPPSPTTRTRSRPLPSPLVLKSATFTASNAGPTLSAVGVTRTATLANPPNSASLRALPPLPPTPKTGVVPRSATFPSSAVPYTPSFPIPTVPSYPSLPPTPATSAIPVALTAGLNEDGVPVSATVERTPSYTRDTVPPVLRTYTKRQRHIEHRIGQVKVQMRLLKRKIASSQVDGQVGERVVADLAKQLAWLEVHLYGDWALEVEGAEKPEGWGRYMRP